MESLSFSERKLSREEIFKGLSASALVHILVFATALISPWGKPKQSVQIPYATVNLVSLEDIGGEVSPASKGQSGKNAEGPKAQDTPKSSSSSSRAKAKPFVPVKRLQLDEPAEKAASPPIKKLEIAEAPKVVETPQNRPSVEKKLDSLIPKPKAEPKPTPIVQKSKSVQTEAPAVKEATPTKNSRTETAESGSKEAKEAKVTKEVTGGGSKDDAGGGSREPTPAQGAQGSPSGGSETGRPGGSGTEAGKAGGKGSGPPGSTGKGTTPGSGQGAPGGSPDGAMVTLARRAYYTKIWSAVRQNWALPEFLKSQRLETVLIVVVRRDGKVLDLRVEKGSGNALYDDSAKRAVRKADPLPPFPDVYTAPQEEIALRFTPELLS